jgi:hypothetical protein
MRTFAFHGAVVTPFRHMHVDPVLLTLARHHAATDDEVHAILDFVSCAAVEMRQFAILLANIGRRRMPLVEGIEVSSYASDTMLSNMAFASHGMKWIGGRISLSRDMPPDTVVAALEGRRLDDLVAHPYLPGDVRIGTIAARDGGWSVGIQADARMPLRR